MSDKALFTIKMVLALGLLAALCALAVGDAEALTVRIVQASGGLNVRESPSVDSKSVYLLDNCQTVVILEQRDGWALAARNTYPHTTLGWVCSDYLK